VSINNLRINHSSRKQHIRNKTTCIAIDVDGLSFTSCNIGRIDLQGAKASNLV